jgi:purine nucleosidase
VRQARFARVSDRGGEEAYRRVRVVVDTDAGIDDALALIWLAAHPDVEIAAVGSTHGNCRADQAAINALRVLETCGQGEVPVAEGLAAPLNGEATFATHVHGLDGLGDAGLALPVGRPSPEGAVEQIVRLSRRAEQLDLLALGPLTNLAAALALDPACLARYRRIVIMGSAGVEQPPGASDATLGVGDPNTAHDPAATARVLAAVGVVFIGADVTLPVRFGSEDLDRLAASTNPVGRMMWAALQHYIAFHEPMFGPRTCCAHDAIAATVLTDPQVVTEWATGRGIVVGDGAEARAVLQPHLGGTSRSVVAIDGATILQRLIGILTADP